MSTTQERYDLDGHESVTLAILDVVNQYPGLLDGDSIKFGIPDEDNGKAMTPISSGIIATEREDVTGRVVQICNYPFYVVSRTGALSNALKISAKEWLDDLGKWLEKQAIVVNGETFKLDEYPQLTGAREFISIERQTPAFLETMQEGQIENWSIYITAQYRNEFLKDD
jgi:hypothetical protein